MTDNQDTRWGRAHGFAGFTSPEQWQSRVPIVDYEDLEPSILDIAGGARNVLTREPVVKLEPTSGSGGVDKLIPYTTGLRKDFNAATNPWFFDLWRPGSRLSGTRSYWSISPVARAPKITSGGLKVGSSDDTEYFSAVERWAIGHLLAVPQRVAGIADIERWREVTVTHLLAADDLGMLSVWSPSFASLLMRSIESNWSRLIERLPIERQRNIRNGIERYGRICGTALWPRLRLISCWAHASAAVQISELRQWFPGVEIQPKGLLATEGVVSFPLRGLDEPVAAVTSHVFEFIDLQAPRQRPLFLHELRTNASYVPLLSTRGGLYRYRLADEVVCVGRFRSVPQLQFVGRVDRHTDLCGEKLGIRAVERALERARLALGLTWRFAMLAPAECPRTHYTLFVDTHAAPHELAALAAHIDDSLQRGHHYRYCRDLGQLGPIRCTRIEDAWSGYCQRLVAEGIGLGNIKPICLDQRNDWEQWFTSQQDSSTPRKMIR